MDVDKKWLYYFNKRFELYKSFIEDFTSTENYKIELATVSEYIGFLIMNFRFDTALDREQKYLLKIHLFEKLVPLYERVLNQHIYDVFHLCNETQIHYSFLECDENTPSNFLEFLIPKNNWKALALSEDTQYLPILSNKN